MPSKLILPVALLVALGTLADTPLRHKGYDAKPPKADNAEVHARVPFLQPERDWERMDIYVPRAAQGDKLPCVVVVYGGGYGDKVLPFKQVKPLLDRGYVVAIPDYALQVFAPEAMACWDIDNAIRFLRKNAAAYRIDPERIGVWGFSAGGWIIQNLCYSDAREMAIKHENWDRLRPGKKTSPGVVPYINPRPLYPRYSARVQAAVSDWGAAKLIDSQRDHRSGKKTVRPAARLSPDDPPLLTCFGGEPCPVPNSSIGFLQALGVPAEAVFLDTKNTHVPSHTCRGWTAAGDPTTWGEAVYDFFDRKLRRVSVSTPPEIALSPGTGTATLLTVHPEGKVFYTLDGNAPTTASPVYEDPVFLAPGATIKAIAVKPGLAPSPVASFALPDEPAQPVITTAPMALVATVGQPFRAAFAATGENVHWFLSGRVGETYRKFAGKSFNPPVHIPWLRIDANGVVSGMPRHPGVYPVIVTAYAFKGTSLRRRSGSITADARLFVVTVNDAE